MSQWPSPLLDRKSSVVSSHRLFNSKNFTITSTLISRKCQLGISSTAFPRWIGDGSDSSARMRSKHKATYSLAVAVVVGQEAGRERASKNVFAFEVGIVGILAPMFPEAFKNWGGEWKPAFFFLRFELFFLSALITTKRNQAIGSRPAEKNLVNQEKGKNIDLLWLYVSNQRVPFYIQLTNQNFTWVVVVEHPHH